MPALFLFGANTQVIGKTEPQKLSYAGAFKPTRGSLSTVATHIGNGHPWMPTVLDEGKPRWQVHANYAELLSADIDTGLTIEEAKQQPFISTYCGLAIESASSTPETNKFRLVFRLPVPVKDWKTIRICNRYLIEQLGVADPACKDASRFYFGAPGRSPFILNELAVLPADFVDRALDWNQVQEEIAEQQAKAAQARWQQWQADNPERDEKALLLDALRFIPPDCDYSDWLSVGMTLCGLFGSEGVQIWDGWSAGSTKHKPGECDRKARTFRSPEPRIGHLINLAKQGGFRFPERKKKEPSEPDTKAYEAYCQWEAEQERVEEAQDHQWTIEAVKTYFDKPTWKFYKRFGRLPEKPRVKPQTHAISYSYGIVPAAGLVKNAKLIYQPDELTEVLQEARTKGYRAVLNTSPTGAGKSHTTAELSSLDLGIDSEDDTAKVWWVDQNHRNVSTSPAEQNFVDMPVRHNGLKKDSDRTTPGGSPHLRHPKTGEQPDTAGNCHLAGLFHAASSKGYQSASETASVNPICRSCQHFGQCGQESGIGFGFRKDRQEAFKKTQIRTAFESMPSPDNHDFVNDVAIVEEADQILKPVTAIQATISDFDTQLADLEQELPDEYGQLLAIKRLRDLVAGRESSYHGLDYQQIHERLGAFPDGVDIDLVASVLNPNLAEVLGGSLDTADRIDEEDYEAQAQEVQSLKGKIERRRAKLQKLLKASSEELENRFQIENINAEIDDLSKQLAEAEKVLSLFRSYNRVERKSAGRINRDNLKQAIANLPSQWLIPFLEVWSGRRPGALRTGRYGGLTVTVEDYRQREILSEMGFVIFLDATLTVDRLSLHSGIPANRILQIEVASEETKNLDVIQVTGFNLAGKNRSESTDKRLVAFTKWAKKQHGEVAVLDHLKKAEATGADGWHFGADARGTNRFQQHNALISIGLPMPDLAVVKDRWLALGGEDTRIAFDDYYRAEIDAAIIQEAGRLRANRRPNQSLVLYHLFDCDRAKFNYSLPLDHRVIDVAQLCPDAATPFDRAMMAVLSAKQKLTEAGEKVTQTAIAAITGFTQQYVSKLLKSLLDMASGSTTNPNRDQYRNSCSQPSGVGEVEPVAQALDFAAENYPESEWLESIYTAFYDWLTPVDWQTLWTLLKGHTQIRLIDALSLAIGGAIA